jgi:hypothetical protein
MSTSSRELVLFYFTEKRKTMADEKEPTGQAPAEAPAQAASDTVEQQEAWDQERAKQTIQNLRAIEKQANKERKELQELRQREEERRLSAMTELEKLQKQAAELADANAKLNMEVLKRDVIAETGLPAQLADRLRGTNKEEMLADAKELLAILPTQQTKQPPRINATNPANATANETDAQRRERLFGRNGKVFDIDSIIKGGGGVVINNKTE